MREEDVGVSSGPQSDLIIVFENHVSKDKVLLC